MYKGKSGAISEAARLGELPREPDYYGVGNYIIPHSDWRLYGHEAFRICRRVSLRGRERSRAHLSCVDGRILALVRNRKMESKIYAIYDSKAEAFMQPFFAGTAGLALRSFADAANNPDSVIAKYPHDFELFELGVFDDQSGKFVIHEHRKPLGFAHEYVEKESPRGQMELVNG